MGGGSREGRGGWGGTCGTSSRASRRPREGGWGGGGAGRGAGGRGRSVRIDIRGCLWQASRRQPLSNVSSEKVAGGRVHLWGRGSESGPGGGWSSGSLERQWQDANVFAASELHRVGKFSSGVLWDTIWDSPWAPRGSPRVPQYPGSLDGLGDQRVDGFTFTKWKFAGNFPGNSHWLC